MVGESFVPAVIVGIVDIGDGSPLYFGQCAGEPSGCLEAPVQTVRGDKASVERRLARGLLRCPCSGVLGPWGWARERVIRWSQQAALDLVRRYLEGHTLPSSDPAV